MFGIAKALQRGLVKSGVNPLQPVILRVTEQYHQTSPFQQIRNFSGLEKPISPEEEIERASRLLIRISSPDIPLDKARLINALTDNPDFVKATLEKYKDITETELSMHDDLKLITEVLEKGLDITDKINDKFLKMAAIGLVESSSRDEKNHYKSLFGLNEEEAKNPQTVEEKLKEVYSNENLDPEGYVTTATDILMFKGLEYLKKTLKCKLEIGDTASDKSYRNAYARDDFEHVPNSSPRTTKKILNKKNLDLMERLEADGYSLRLFSDREAEQVMLLIAKEFVEFSSEEAKDIYAKGLKISKEEIRSISFLANNLEKLVNSNYEKQSTYAIELCVKASKHAKKRLAAEISDEKDTSRRR